VEELWSLEPEQFENLKYVLRILKSSFNVTIVFCYHCFSNYFRPIHGLIFLFKWVPNEEVAGTVVQDNRLDKLFFAKQV